ncbi:uncharacterized protein [Miscanthus floridulus]|uniref:uncharacterized protein isoform X2 n=1 Tax=Miscanthus floridulus TaxID=154761 RepID=UPI0034591C1F
MDPEDSSEFEEDEEEDDDLMLFILPALYLASTGIGTLDQRSMVSDGTVIETPSQVSKFNDAEWICKVLEDDRGQGYDKLRVEPHILLELSRYLRSNDLLRNTRGVSVEEKIGMFIYMLSRNASFQKLNDRFKYSTETIHRHIKVCFDAVTPMTAEFVKPPLIQAHRKISSDTRYGPYFENCIGAIDGIHVPMTISDSEAAPYRNRQESLSQNVMLACDFDLNFVYVSCSREGSASDAAVLYSAIESGFEVPRGKYYLVDGGYANMPSFLAPYNEVPYHTEEQDESNFQPMDYRELFNLRHAQLHRHIKRAVGLLKMRFPILNVATSYRKDTQLKIPSAAVVLHNIIQRQGAFNSECDMGNALRDGIALRMWADYESSMCLISE